MEKQRKKSFAERCREVLRRMSSDTTYEPVATDTKISTEKPGLPAIVAKNGWFMDDARTLSSINTSAFESSSDEESY
ncbi:hypothetical protein RNJ44_02318 [Nakaseomyces bracarensis]|uniref:Uncharacterized protein n=1 Tax=Nakaseomyces bracarensis TaxID=273131 RepID=A0ABR4NN37_9SACH